MPTPPASNNPVPFDLKRLASMFNMDPAWFAPMKLPDQDKPATQSSDPTNNLTLLVEGAQPSQDIPFIGHHQNYFRSDFTSAVQNTFGGKTATYDWSGDDSYPSMQKAGGNLATTINLYRRNHPDAKVNVVAHSHGGNVAFIASQSAPIDTLVTMGTPIISRFQPKQNNIGLHINGYSSGDLIQSPYSYDFRGGPFPEQTVPSAINVKIPQSDDVAPNPLFPHFEILTPTSWEKIDKVYQAQP